MKDYIQDLIKQGKRSDGRSLDEYRKPVSIETGISKNAEGSARVKIGGTEVIVGVKMEIGEPYPDSPDEGTIIVSAEFLAMSNPEFESGPPGIEAVTLARVVDRTIRESKFLDFKKLCIKEGEQIWMVFIDLYTINDEGNLIDAAALGAIAALKSAKVPKIVDGKVDYGELTSKGLPITKDLPMTITLNKILDKTIVDPTTDEEEAVSTKLSIGVKGDLICALQKDGESSISVDEVMSMVDTAFKKRDELIKVIK